MHDRRFVRNWDRLAATERDALQVRRLRTILRDRVVPFSGHYRRTFAEHRVDIDALRSLADLERIPFTTKADLLPDDVDPEGPRKLILRPTPELVRSHLPLFEKLRFGARKALLGSRRFRDLMLEEFAPTGMVFTTGRSTGAIPFFLTNYDFRILREAGRRMVNVLRLDPIQDRIVNLFPYAPHLAFWQVAFVALGGNILTLNTGGGRVMGVERLLGVMQTLRPTVAVGMPGYFYHLVRCAVAGAADLSSLRLVALGGENVPLGFRRRLTEMLISAGARDPAVVSVLGFTEARQCWTECAGARRSGFHTSPDLGLFEIIDPVSGRRLPDGETGELVYTSLDGRGSMVVRYRTGDMVEGGITKEPCPGCGRTVPRVASDIRRVSNVKSLDVDKIKGTLVDLNSLVALFGERPELEEWQLVIQKKDDDPFERDELILHAALRPGTDAGHFEQDLQRSVRARTEVGLDRFRIESLESLLKRIGMEDRIKEERILDRRSCASASRPSGSS